MSTPGMHGHHLAEIVPCDCPASPCVPHLTAVGQFRHTTCCFSLLTNVWTSRLLHNAFKPDTKCLSRHTNKLPVQLSTCVPHVV